MMTLVLNPARALTMLPRKSIRRTCLAVPGLRELKRGRAEPLGLRSNQGSRGVGWGRIADQRRRRRSPFFSMVAHSTSNCSGKSPAQGKIWGFRFLRPFSDESYLSNNYFMLSASRPPSRRNAAGVVSLTGGKHIIMVQ